MNNHVRTTYGVAVQGFSSLVKWLLGVMQGGGHSGGLWALTSSIMFDQMEDTIGATFHSPYPKPGCHRTGEAFVDDAAMWLLCMGMMFTTLLAHMRVTAQ